MSDNVIAEVRAFNRFYTRQIGLLDEHIARSFFSLAEGRVLYEIGKRVTRRPASSRQAPWTSIRPISAACCKSWSAWN